MQITVELLKQLGACFDQITLFSELYPNGVSWNTQEELQQLMDEASKKNLDIKWFANKMKLSCICRGYYPNGQLFWERSYMEGEIEGGCKEYYANGQLWWEGNFIKGRYNGFWKEYYENGRLLAEGNYINGSRDGIWKHYRRDGQLRYTEKYINGISQLEEPQCK